MEVGAQREDRLDGGAHSATAAPVFDRVFRLSLWLKAADGGLELLGGLLLLLTPSSAIQAAVRAVTVPELTADPTDVVAHTLFVLGQQLGAQRIFGAVFLLTHGVVKLVLVYYLLRGVVRAYPWAIAALSLFAAYQGYLAWIRSSFTLLGLTVFDLFIVWMAVHEYQHLRGIAARQP
ncbi:MAG: DUF2127 domain-containing protein [Gemmatimonadota bacterium]